MVLTDAEQAFGSTLAPTGTVTKGKVLRIGTQRVVDLLVDGGKSGARLRRAPPAPRTRSGSSTASSAKQHVDLDHYGSKVKITAPPAAKVRTVPGF